jgi:hypothetical protein
MRTYRVQARALGEYLNGTVNAESDLAALEEFSRKVKEGRIQPEEEPLYTKKKTFITYEEL